MCAPRLEIVTTRSGRMAGVSAVAERSDGLDRAEREVRGDVPAFVVTPRVRARARPPVAARGQAQGHGHLGYVDGLRALAALFVVLHHAWLQIWPVDYARSPTGMDALLTGWMAYGHFAVSVFIVVSGFSLALPIVRGDGSLRGGARGFLWRRAKRILPPYYGAIAFSLLLIATLVGRKTGTHWDMSIPVTWHTLEMHLLMLQDLFGQGKINHVFWSIAIEWRIYFLFPLMVLLWRRVGTGLTTLGVMAAAYIAQYRVSGTWLAPATPDYVALFALGAVAATIAFSREPRWRLARAALPWTAAALGFAALLVALCWRWGSIFGWGDPSMLVIADTLAGLMAAAALVAASRAEGRNPLRAALGWGPLVSVGVFSYSLYLVHAPLLQVAWQYLAHPLGFSGLAELGLLLLTGLPLILGVAYLFHRVCERPFMNTRRAPAASRQVKPEVRTASA